jgi:hypothetical protein
MLFSLFLHSSRVIGIPNIDPTRRRRLHLRHHHHHRHRRHRRRRRRRRRCCHHHRYRSRKKANQLVLVQMFLFLDIVHTGNR